MLETKFTALEKDNKEIKTNVDREIYKKKQRQMMETDIQRN